jgi:hypothetical protein
MTREVPETGGGEPTPHSVGYGYTLAKTGLLEGRTILFIQGRLEPYVEPFSVSLRLGELDHSVSRCTTYLEVKISLVPLLSCRLACPLRISTFC